MSFLADFTTQQQISTIVISKVSALLSLGGSSYIVHRTLTSRKDESNRRNRMKAITKERLVLGLSIVDVFQSVSYFVGPWAFSSDELVVTASGTDATCTIEGFFFSLGMNGTLMYNFVLACYFLLVVRFSYTSNQVRVKEKYMHGLAIGYPLLGAVVSVALNVLNPKGVVCMITADPEECQGDEQCLKNLGGKVAILGFLFGVLTLLGTILFGTVVMIILYRHVRKTEKRMLRYSSANDGGASKAVAHQGCLYILSLLLCWVPSLIHNIVQWAGGKPSFGAQFASALTNPLQGLFNMYVFTRTYSATDTSEETNTITQFFQNASSTLKSLIGFRFGGSDSDSGSGSGGIVANGCGGAGGGGIVAAAGPPSSLSLSLAETSQQLFVEEQQNTDANDGKEGDDDQDQRASHEESVIDA